MAADAVEHGTHARAISPVSSQLMSHAAAISAGLRLIPFPEHEVVETARPRENDAPARADASGGRGVEPAMTEHRNDLRVNVHDEGGGFDLT